MGMWLFMLVKRTKGIWEGGQVKRNLDSYLHGYFYDKCKNKTYLYYTKLTRQMLFTTRFQKVDQHAGGTSNIKHHGPSSQIRKIAGCACAGNAGNVFPRRRFQRKPLVSDPEMHHGTCVTHVPWCMSGSLTRGDGENVPGIPGACAPAILRIWQEAHCTIYPKIILTENVNLMQRRSMEIFKSSILKQGKSEGFDSCDRPSNLTQIGLKLSIFQPVWPWNLMDDLKNYRPPLLHYIKLCA